MGRERGEEVEGEGKEVEGEGKEVEGCTPAGRFFTTAKYPVGWMCVG